MKIKNRRFTKDEISTLIKLWETKTISELAEELERPVGSILYLANKIRKVGYKLPKKQTANTASYLIKEVLNDLHLGKF